jgi:large repetitive protein
MKNILFTLLFCIINNAILSAQSTTPTIGPVSGQQYFCLTTSNFNMDVSITLNGYTGVIHHYTIEWELGGTPQTVPFPAPAVIQHSYSFTNFFQDCAAFESKKYITLLIYNSATDATPLNNIFIATFKKPPRALFTPNPLTACAGGAVTFSNNSCPSSDPTMQYVWNYGDGTPTNGTGTHTYAAAGSYTVTMTATNSCGTNSTTGIVTSYAPPIAAIRADSGFVTGAGGQAVGAGTDASPYIICLGGGGRVKLDASISQNETSYQWSAPWFGSGYTYANGHTTRPTPRVTFTTAGTYTVTVSVNNQCNAPSTATAVIRAVSAVTLTIDRQANGCNSLIYTPSPFIAGATYTINGVPATFPRTLLEGHYVVVGTLVNECGSQTVSDTFDVLAPENVMITAPANNLQLCTGGASVPLVATPPGGVWSGGTFTGNTSFDPITAGVYTVVYTRGSGQCERTASITITVTAQPVLTLNPQPDDCVDINYTPSPLVAGATYKIDGVVVTTFPKLLSSGSHTVEANIMNNCGSQTQNDTFSITPPSAISIRLPFAADTSVCVSSSNINLNALPTGGVWSGSSFLVGNVFSPMQAGDYTLTYTRGTGNCMRTKSVVIHVLGASATAQDIQTCSYTPSVALVGTPAGGVWSSPTCPTCVSGTTFTLQGSLTTAQLVYTVANSIGCSAVGNATLTVADPQAAFTFVSACTGQDVAISTSVVADAIIWRIDGVTTATQPPFAPLSAGAHTIEQVAVIGTCRDSVQQTIQVIAAPNAIFAMDKVAGCAPLSVTFTNSSTGDNVTYLWDFGDGTLTSTAIVPPVHTFAQAECDTVYTVKLTATNLCNTSVLTQTVLVHPKPVPRFDVSDNIICHGDSIDFIEATLPCNNTNNFVWDFGDGTTSTAVVPPPHRYTAFGNIRTYTISRRGTNNCGDSTMTKMITVKPIDFKSFIGVDSSLGCQPLGIRFRDTVRLSGVQFQHNWDFGDGFTSNAAAPTHIFLNNGIFTVRHWVSDGCGWTDTTMQITVLPQPTVSFATPRDTCAGKPFYFKNTSNNLALSFIWGFGDGATSTAISPTHTYVNAGSYSISVVGSSVNGCKDTAYATVNSRVNPQFSLSPMQSISGCSPLSAVLSVADTPVGSTYFYAWNFGDGGTASGQTVTHLYTRTDSVRHYYPKLRVTDQYGCQMDSVFGLGVHTFPLPNAAFSATTNPKCGINVTANFVNTSTGAINYVWDFGDSQTSNTETPTHQYVSSSGRIVTLTAKNTYLCADSVQHRLEYCDGLFIPSAFSPETGLGEVRLFGVKGLGIEQYRLSVYSRFGNLIWATDKLEQGLPTERWDGTFNGQIVPQDMYIWKCEAVFENGNIWQGQADKSGALQKVGTVTVLR